MIRTNEAILRLNTSPPTFYKWVKKLGIELISKKTKTGKIGLIRSEDLDEIAKAMWKNIVIEEGRQQFSKSEPEKATPSPDLELLKEVNDLKVEKTTLSNKVEEYSGYVEIYKEQLAIREQSLAQLETERKNMYTQILQVQVRLSTYKVLLFAVLGIIVLFALLFGLKIIQLG